MIFFQNKKSHIRRFNIQTLTAPGNNCIDDLKGHFNDQFKNFEDNLIGHIENIDKKINFLKSLEIPEKDKFYVTLSNEYDKVSDSFYKQRSAFIDFLIEAKLVLESKKASPFSSVNFNVKCPQFNAFSLEELNSLIANHNQKFNNHIETQKSSRNDLKLHYIARSFDDYNIKNEAKEKSEGSLSAVLKEIDILEQEIKQLNAEILNHKKAVTELNGDLKTYLKHEELRFISEDHGHGYKIIRGSQIARSLSEGEKTAIALLYFLKSLKDRDFNLKDGIVVIDDPVSSLDEHALFNAFGFIKDRTKEAKQLFLLTHNKIFFSQVKYWLTRTKGDKENTSFYQTTCHIVDGSRISKIIELDRLLTEYDSEYHYLFYILYSYNSDQFPLKDANNSYLHIYALPNIARRLIEAFLSFRYPDKNNLYDKFNASKMNSAEFITILRFLDYYSHNNDPDIGYHNTSIVSGGSDVISSILKFIKSEDKDHYEKMVEAINKKNLTTQKKIKQISSN